MLYRATGTVVPRRECTSMTCKPKTLISIEDAYMRRLIHTTGISTVQARDLVTMLGCDLSSLIREAHLLMRKPRA